MISDKKELMNKAEARKKEFQAQLAKLKADTTSTANEKTKELEKKVQEIENYLKEGTQNFTDEVAKKINNWLQ